MSRAMKIEARALAVIKRRYPEYTADEQRDAAIDLICEWEEDREDTPDTDCIEDRMPLEYFTERGEA